LRPPFVRAEERAVKTLRRAGTTFNREQKNFAAKEREGGNQAFYTGSYSSVAPQFKETTHTPSAAIFSRTIKELAKHLIWQKKGGLLN